MRYIVERARKIEVIKETDVLVVGSGPGGLSAALAAARAGVSVTLVERFGCFGGNITAVGVEGFAWYRHEGTIDSEGIGREFESHAWDGEAFKVVADNMVLEAGIIPMLHRCFVEAVMEGERIKGNITESKAGREAILARQVVDATGDGDVARRAGAPTHKTPKEEMMAASVLFSISGVDLREFIDDLKANSQTYKDWESGEWSAETNMDIDLLQKELQRQGARLH